MRVLIFLPYEFPYGSAGASRVDKYARGLRAAGVDACVVGASFQPDAGARGEWRGTAQGVPYRLVRLEPPAWLRTSVSTYVQVRRRFLEALASDGAWDAAIIYGQWGYVCAPLLRACRARGIAAVVECNEWPPCRSFSGGCFGPFYWDRVYFRRRCLRAAQGVIGISSFWEQYLEGRGVPVIRIPALGDDEQTVSGCPLPVPSGLLPRTAEQEIGNRKLETGNGKRQEADPFVVCYLGAFEERDLPWTLLESIRCAVGRGLNARLVVLGPAACSAAGKKAKSAAERDAVLRERVEFRPAVPQPEVPAALAPFHALVLARDETRETRACFPTRLPEYLHTGRPVVLSAAGDIPLYFRHRQDAWLTAPGHRPEQFAEAYLTLAKDPALAAEIGRRGRETARREFSYRRHGERLKEFLRSLIELNLRTEG